MSKVLEILIPALQRASAGRPKVGGFPYFAETLRAAGLIKNSWSLPSCQSVYVTTAGSVICQGEYLITDTAEVPPFDQEALVRALRIDQAGESNFQEFLMAAWQAGVVRYEVDFIARTVTYYGCLGESYLESYPEISS